MGPLPLDSMDPTLQRLALIFSQAYCMDSHPQNRLDLADDKDYSAYYTPLV